MFIVENNRNDRKHSLKLQRFLLGARSEMMEAMNVKMAHPTSRIHQECGNLAARLSIITLKDALLTL